MEHDLSKNFAFITLEKAYKAQRDWHNQLGEARAFLLACNEEPDAKSIALFEEVGNNVKELRQAMLYMLSATGTDFDWTGDL